jgi:signal peptidase I
MQVLTAFILAAFCSYAGSWYFGFIEGNFALLMLMAVVISGVYWLAEKFYFWPQRLKAVEQLDSDKAKRQQDLAKMGIERTDTETGEARNQLLMQPWWLDWTAGLFPVILFIFILRSFLYEPFKIPSGSMIPTLWVGDLILVNKFHYGVRLPVVNTKITQGTPVARGDVMVFKYPPRPSVDYIKRVVGIPGDEIAYLNKKLTINGQAVPTEAVPEFFDESVMRYSKQFQEKLGPKTHNLLVDDDRPAFIPGAEDFPFKERCNYTVEGVTCRVPEGHYFMMGDNRDNSLDSRYWGFVPDANIVGKAFFVWMNFGNLGRIGSFN